MAFRSVAQLQTSGGAGAALVRGDRLWGAVFFPHEEQPRPDDKRAEHNFGLGTWGWRPAGRMLSLAQLGSELGNLGIW